MKQMENGEKRRTENDMKRIPFRLIPAEKENLWGGSYLKNEYGKQTEIRRLAETFNSMSEKIETLDITRNQFVANASHELKTPLASMKVLVESLIYQPDMDRGLRTEFLQDINREIDRLSAIVSDLLTLVRMDAGSVKLSREKLTLQDLVEENRHRLDPMARKRRQELVINIKDPCELNADKGKMNQVITSWKTPSSTRRKAAASS